MGQPLALAARIKPLLLFKRAVPSLEQGRGRFRFQTAYMPRRLIATRSADRFHVHSAGSSEDRVGVRRRG
jgi:hypothetical protein